MNRDYYICPNCGQTFNKLKNYSKKVEEPFCCKECKEEYTEFVRRANEKLEKRKHFKCI